MLTWGVTTSRLENVGEDMDLEIDRVGLACDELEVADDSG